MIKDKIYINLFDELVIDTLAVSSTLFSSFHLIENYIDPRLVT